ncbi:hypothetical protein NL676_026960 [Syzygium grande]|nr:hypothetical protein NL676_026960 [Syzygium grande]
MVSRHLNVYAKKEDHHVPQIFHGNRVWTEGEGRGTVGGRQNQPFLSRGTGGSLAGFGLTRRRDGSSLLISRAPEMLPRVGCGFRERPSRCAGRDDYGIAIIGNGVSRETPSEQAPPFLRPRASSLNPRARVWTEGEGRGTVGGRQNQPFLSRGTGGSLAGFGLPPGWLVAADFPGPGNAPSGRVWISRAAVEVRDETGRDDYVGSRNSEKEIVWKKKNDGASCTEETQKSIEEETTTPAHPTSHSDSQATIYSGTTPSHRPGTPARSRHVGPNLLRRRRRRSGQIEGRENQRTDSYGKEMPTGDSCRIHRTLRHPFRRNARRVLRGGDFLFRGVDGRDTRSVKDQEHSESLVVAL